MLGVPVAPATLNQRRLPFLLFPVARKRVKHHHPTVQLLLAREAFPVESELRTSLTRLLPAELVLDLNAEPTAVIEFDYSVDPGVFASPDRANAEYLFLFE